MVSEGDRDSLTLGEKGSAPLAGWQPIETAVGKGGYIVGAWKDGSHWYFAEVFEEHDDWVDVHSDRIHKPTHWTHLPPTDGTEPETAKVRSI